jgi:hypothetical protein
MKPIRLPIRVSSRQSAKTSPQPVSDAMLLCDTDPAQVIFASRWRTDGRQGSVNAIARLSRRTSDNARNNKMATISRSIFFLAGLFAVAAASAQSAEFAGSWSAWICPAGAQPEGGKCSSFVLVLHQKQDKLCGTHVFATAGARAMDEGGVPSVSGTVADGTAGVVIESGRSSPGTKVPGELKAGSRSGLQWKRLENPKGDYLLPASAQFTKSRSGSMFSPVFEQRVKAACTAQLNAAVDAAPSAAPPGPPASPASSASPAAPGNPEKQRPAP